MFLLFPHVSQEMIVKASPVLSIFEVSVVVAVVGHVVKDCENRMEIIQDNTSVI